MKPLAEANAKIFALDAKLKEEEAERSTEYTFLKDTLRRLVYTMEHQDKLGQISLNKDFS